MRIHLAALAVVALVYPQLSEAQITLIGGKPTQCAVADLQAGTCGKREAGETVETTDSLNRATCSQGGGSERVRCLWNPTKAEWEPTVGTTQGTVPGDSIGPAELADGTDSPALNDFIAISSADTQQVVYLGASEARTNLAVFAKAELSAAPCDLNTEKMIGVDATTGAPLCQPDLGGIGSNVALDLGATGQPFDSDSLTRIETTGDTNLVFTEPLADVLRINVAANWPTADTAADLTCTGCVSSTELDELGVETALEAVLDLLDLQGQLPGNRVDSATTTARGTVTLANDGESIAGEVVQANDVRLSNSRPPTGSAGGDLTGTYPNPTIAGDKVGTAALDDGADIAGSGDYLRVDTVDQLGLEYRTPAEVLTDIGAAASAHSHVDADLPVELAYEDEANVFTSTQTVDNENTLCLGENDVNGSDAFCQKAAAALPAGGFTVTWNVTGNCSGNVNGGALTVNASNEIVCSDDDGGAGGSGDNITVNGTASEDGNFLDNLYTDWALETGTTPDNITAKPNYAETLAGNPALAAGEAIFSTDGSGGVLFEGTADTVEGLLAWAPTSADRTLTLPDATDTLVGLATTDTLTNKTIDTAQNTITVVEADVSDLSHTAPGTGLSGAAGGTIDVASTEPGFLTDGGVTSLTCGVGDAGKAHVLDDGSVEYCDGADTLQQGFLDSDGIDDDVPEAGDFGAATDLDANGAVVADGVALGTDTTGSYVASVATGDGLTGGAAGSEGPALTLSVVAGLGIDLVGGAVALKTSDTLAGNPALGTEECVFSKDGAGSGAVLCEGSVADGFEGLFLFPDVTGADSTQTLVTDTTQAGGDLSGTFSALTIGSNTVGSDALMSTTVSPGTYGDGSNVAQFTVDQDGRLTFADNVPITAAGDISSVGNCTGGDCFVDGSNNGTELIFEGATVDTAETRLRFSGDPTSDGVLTIPNNVTGEVSALGQEIALTAETSGDYVASAQTGVGLTGGAAGSEGAALTLSWSYADTLAANPALNAEECVASTDGAGGGGFLCEGSVADAFEGLFLFPDVTGADATQEISALGQTIEGSEVTDGTLTEADTLRARALRESGDANNYISRNTGTNEIELFPDAGTVATPRIGLYSMEFDAHPTNGALSTFPEGLDTGGQCSITTTTTCDEDADCPGGETCINTAADTWNIKLSDSVDVPEGNITNLIDAHTDCLTSPCLAKEAVEPFALADLPTSTEAQLETHLSDVTDAITNNDAMGGALTGNMPSPTLAADAVDAITEIAAALKSGADLTLVTGTSGTSGNLVEWNVDGDAVDSGIATSAVALLAGPDFTGDPTAPTPATADNDTSIATTAFVQAQTWAVSEISGKTHVETWTGSSNWYPPAAGGATPFEGNTHPIDSFMFDASGECVSSSRYLQSDYDPTADAFLYRMEFDLPSILTVTFTLDAKVVALGVTPDANPASTPTEQSACTTSGTAAGRQQVSCAFTDGSFTANRLVNLKLCRTDANGGLVTGPWVTTEQYGVQ